MAARGGDLGPCSRDTVPDKDDAMTTRISAETTAFIEYLRESRAARDLADAIADVLTRRAQPVVAPVRVEARATRRVAS